MANQDPSSLSVAPVEPTSTPKRGRGAPKGTRHVKEPLRNTRLQNDVALLRVEGMARKKIADLAGVSPMTVQRIEALPEVQARIAELREIHRKVTMERGTSVGTKMWDRLDDAVTNGTAKDVNLLTFAQGALERTLASASGEKQQVEVSGMAGTQAPRVEIKNLLLQLFPQSDKPLSGN